MKKLLLTLTLVTSLFTIPTQVSATPNEITIPVLQIEVLQGVISESNSPEYIYIDTIDGNGWVLEVQNENSEETFFTIDGELCLNDKVVVVFDNMGTKGIYDDEIIQVVKVK